MGKIVDEQPPPQQDGNHLEDDFFCDFQLFDEHCEQAERFRKTLYYGELPAYNDRPSLALTSLALEFFIKSLPPRDELRFLDMDYASRVMRNACVTPASVVVALMYADRLRLKNPQYMAQTNSCDLFLVSMMVASKFLYDDGVEDEVYNQEWAKAADLEVKQINREERQFLNAIQWQLMVRPNEFSSVVADLERRIALRELAKRRISNSSTYTELDVLTNQTSSMAAIYDALYDYVLKVVTVSMVSYCACLLTVFASVAAVQFVMPVAKPSADRDNSACTNSSIPSDSAATPYSGLILEHQKELEVILRGEQIEMENSTMSCIANSGVAENVSWSRFDKLISIEIRSWELLKRFKMSGVLRNDVFPFSREPRILIS